MASVLRRWGAWKGGIALKRSAVLVGWSVAACCALAAPAAAEQVAPALPVVAWHGPSANLEDFKGQVTALVFFTDSTA